MSRRYQASILGVGFNPLLAPNAPTNVTPTATSTTSISVAFTAPADVGGSAITGYVLFVSSGAIVTGSSSPIVVSGLDVGTSYTFRVYANNIYGNGPFSATSSSVSTLKLPGTPTSVSATAGAGQAIVSFTAPSDLGVPAASSYRVTSSPGGITAAGSSSPITITGLTGGTSYTFTVAAQNTAGFSPESSVSNSVTPTSPGVIATGGTISNYTSGGVTYRQHVFTGSGTFSVSQGGNVQVLIVGGGGGGGMLGGGGGGGGVAVASGTVTAINYSITVGNGGAGQRGWLTSGDIAYKGGSSSVFGITAFGGGGARSYSSGGAASENQNVANYGGLGYGQTSYAAVSASFATTTFPGGWTGTAFQNYVGGLGATGCCPCGGGGGGGAAAAGVNNNSQNDGSNKPNGGAGVLPSLSGVPMYSGQNFYFGGGGGADGYCSMAGGDGGIGAGGGGAGTSGTFGTGGSGGINNPTAPGSGGSQWGGNGGVNTGGGGGAGSNGSGSTDVRGGTGGSGIVVIRYVVTS
jgi:hypothetical protein